MTTNPYTNRKMVTNPADLYGRRQILSEIFNNATTGQSVSILGERRIGKSSLLNMLCNRDMQSQFAHFNFENTLFVYIDLLDKADIQPVEFFWAILKEINLKLDRDNVFTLPDGDSYDAFRQVIEQLCRDQNYRLIICLDGFDTVIQNKSFDFQFYSFLRSIANQYSVALVTASQHRLGELCHPDEIKGSPFFNIFTTLRLGLFSEEEALELMTRPSRENGIRFEQQHVDYISNLVGRHPFFIQIACYHIFEDIKTDEILTPRDYQQIERSVFDQVEGHLQYAIDHMADDEKSTLIAISQSHDVDAISKTVLEELEAKGYLVYNKGNYQLFGYLLEKYIAYYLLDKSVNTVQVVEEKSESNHDDLIVWDQGELRGMVLNRAIKTSSSIGKIKIDHISRIELHNKVLISRNPKFYEFKVFMKNGNVEITNILDYEIFIQTATQPKKIIEIIDIERIEFGA